MRKTVNQTTRWETRLSWSSNWHRVL